jgi:hypothetical protein
MAVAVDSERGRFPDSNSAGLLFRDYSRLQYLCMMSMSMRAVDGLYLRLVSLDSYR